MNVDEMIALFAPHDLERRQALMNGKRLVHYTSAEAAYRIVRGAEIWLRNATVMNDFSEIAHGIACLREAWGSPAGLSFKAMLDRLKPNLSREVEDLFDGHAEGLRINTYLTSLSEHDDRDDVFGRLSMWRAYGGSSGVALVVNPEAFGTATDEMQAYSAPVSYRSVNEFVAWFERWVGRLLVAEVAIATIDPDLVRDYLFMLFRNFALCTKHPGFAEEREWRIFHSPDHERRTDWLQPSIEVVRGLPQPLVKLRLFDDEARGVVGVAPKGLINRVLIGPTNYPLQVSAAMHEALEHVGVQDPASKIWMTFIPLRQA